MTPSLLAIFILITVLTLTPPSWACQPMKPGECQIRLDGLARESGFSNWGLLTIYNDACEVLGSVSKPKQGMSITSQLPYTVELRRLSTTYWRKGSMFYDYADEKLKGFPACDFVEDKGAGDELDKAEGLPAVLGWNQCYSNFRCSQK
ncbi:hypothetical protein Slin15195_G005730 [Septoria linicola]|uniref:Uncharacterized protein n=1 Tax=Septoria linicola TaxID=215465 RepID=A0A9Q9ACY0_9PEZI|nr:hypothetical protein Slin15195_G005730 [Septoria linicola]